MFNLLQMVWIPGYLRRHHFVSGNTIYHYFFFHASLFLSLFYICYILKQVCKQNVFMCLLPGSFELLLSVTKTLFLLCFWFWFIYLNNIFQMAMSQMTSQVLELSQVHVYQSILYTIK